MSNPEMRPFEAMFSGDGSPETDLARLQRSYEKQANHLRMRFFDVFNDVLNDFNPGENSWIVYEIPEIEQETPHDVLVNRYIALLAYIPRDERETVADLTLRVVTNDYYIPKNGKKQIMSEDFILDHNNMAQYGVRTSTEGAKDIRAKHIPLFAVNDENELEFCTFRPHRWLAG